MICQRVLLDRLRASVYIAAGLLGVACPARPGPLLPLLLAPASRAEALAFVAEFRPQRPLWHRVRWRYEDREQVLGGRGSARVVPPDSLRFDFAGPLNFGAGAAVVVGGETVWARPERNFRSLVPAVALLWAALGIVNAPDPGAGLYRARDGWRFVTGGDTLDYRYVAGAARQLDVEWRRDGAVLGRGTTELGPGGLPRLARFEFPEQGARLQLTVVASDTNAVFPPSLWRPPPDR